MERSTWMVFGGLAVLLAIILQLTMLQGSGAQVEVDTRSLRTAGCPPFQVPYATVGRYLCSRRHRTVVYSCKLHCPANMRAEPQKQLLTYKCVAGKWLSVNDDGTQCIARRSVRLVEQRLAPPALLNTLIESYLNHSYTYFAMAYFCDRADVQLPGFHKFFLEMWKASLDLAQDLMTYLNKRGGWFSLKDLQRPQVVEKLYIGLDDNRVGLTAMQTALDMERESQERILEIMKRVEDGKMKDPHLLHMLEDRHLEYKVKTIKKIADIITNLRSFIKTGEGDYELGEYEVDNNLQ